ncbi:MAG TPA: cytochrome c(L), periplasmic [Methylotenera sp.]|nr:cytochrome c(L), periplasmic [Methylotenera sp.]HPN02043.1 cytochrome c(L), periplasmic [Methylotenera sp.]
MYKLIKPSHTSALMATILATFLTACQASQQADKTTAITEPVSKNVQVANADVQTPAKAATTDIVVDDGPDLEFRGTISGDLLDFKDGKGDDTPAVKQFKKTGKNPYNGNESVIKNGYTIFSTACSGCHGHLAEGKLGPALADSYWTYPGNKKDKGLFETIYAGGQGMMGPQKGLLAQDEILQVMSWIRSLQNKDAKPAAH